MVHIIPIITKCIYRLLGFVEPELVEEKGRNYGRTMKNYSDGRNNECCRKDGFLYPEVFLLCQEIDESIQSTLGITEVRVEEE